MSVDLMFRRCSGAYLGSQSHGRSPRASASLPALSSPACVSRTHYDLTKSYATDCAPTLQPKFPTFPNPLSPSQTSAGLAAPAAAAVVMGKGGAIAILLVVLYVAVLRSVSGCSAHEIKRFSMAVTSAVSAELIAVSSLL